MIPVVPISRSALAQLPNRSLFRLLKAKFKGQPGYGLWGVPQRWHSLKQASERLREVALDQTDHASVVHIGVLPEHLEHALAKLGARIPAGTPHFATAHKIRHAQKEHAALTPDDFTAIPYVIQSPDWVGYSSSKRSGLKRVWFIKQNGADTLYIAVYGMYKGHLVMHGFYKEPRGKILADLKGKGVPLEAVAKSAVSPSDLSKGNPGSQPGLIGSRNTPLLQPIVRQRQNELQKSGGPIREAIRYVVRVRAMR